MEFYKQDLTPQILEIAAKYSFQPEEYKNFCKSSRDYKLVYLYQKKGSEEAYKLLRFCYYNMTEKYQNYFDYKVENLNLLTNLNFFDVEEGYFKKAAVKVNIDNYPMESYYFYINLWGAYMNCIRDLTKLKKNRTIIKKINDSNPEKAFEIPDERYLDLGIKGFDDSKDMQMDFYLSLNPNSFEAELFRTFLNEKKYSEKKVKDVDIAIKLGKDKTAISRKKKEMEELYIGYRIELLQKEYAEETNQTLKKQIEEEIRLKRKRIAEERLSENQLAIYYLFMENPSIKQIEICNMMGKKDYAISKEVAHIKRMNLIDLD